MNVWAQLVAILRENDANNIDSERVLEILDGEVRGVSSLIQQNKCDIKKIVDKQQLIEESKKGLQLSIAEYEAYTLKALAVGDNELVLSIIDKIAALETDIVQQNKELQILQKSVSAKQYDIKQTKQYLVRLKQQLDTAKAAVNVQRAKTVVQQYNCKPRTAIDAVMQINANYVDKNHRIATHDEQTKLIKDEALERKLIEAGIITMDKHHSDILQRIRLKNKDLK